MTGFIAAAVVVAAGVGYSAYESRQARQDQRKANKRAARIEAIRGQRERADALRSSRVNAANIFAMGANAGVAGSSGVQGALASQQTNLATRLNEAGNIDILNQQRLALLDRAEGHLGRADIGQAVAQIGSLGARA